MVAGIGGHLLGQVDDPVGDATQRSHQDQRGDANHKQNALVQFLASRRSMLTLDDFQYLLDGQVAIVVQISAFNPVHKGRRK